MNWGFLIILFLPLIIFSQKIFTVDYASQADLKIFVVEGES